MNARLRVFAIALACLLLTASFCSAVEFRSENILSVPAGTTLPDDLYAAGSSLNIAGTVNGDLFGAASTITLSGGTTHDAIITGNSITITGRVGDDLRAAGGTVTISGTVVDSASVAGGTVTIPASGKIARNLGVTGGTVQIDGTVARSLVIAGGQVTINGTIGGDVIANVGQLTIGPNAVIRGNLTYASTNAASIASGARILGKTVRRPVPVREHKVSPVAKIVWWVLRFLMMLVVGLVIVAVAPRMSEAVADRMVTAPWISLLIGFLVFVAFPALMIAIAITVIGLPLALILLVMYLIAIYISRIFVAVAIGRLIFRSVGGRRISPFLALFVGLLILWVLITIPIIGGLINVLAIFFGLGAMAYQRYTGMRDLRREERI